MKALEITFRSGAQVIVDATDWSVSTNKISGEISELGWTTPAKHARKLVKVRLDEVAAVVEIA